MKSVLIPEVNASALAAEAEYRAANWAQSRPEAATLERVAAILRGDSATLRRLEYEMACAASRAAAVSRSLYDIGGPWMAFLTINEPPGWYPRERTVFFYQYVKEAAGYAWDAGQHCLAVFLERYLADTHIRPALDATAPDDDDSDDDSNNK